MTYSSLNGHRKFTWMAGTIMAFLATVPLARAQGILAGSAEVAGYVGGVHGNFNSSTSLGPPETNNHIQYGGSGGYNLSQGLTVFGEYGYMPMGTFSGVKFTTQLFGGGIRANFMPTGRVVPYATFAVGGNRFTGSESAVAVSANGYYVGFGGGASVYISRNFGVRPEFRFERQSVTLTVSGASATASSNVLLGSGSVFFQFGGRGKKK
jgi:hypothetical protein